MHNCEFCLDWQSIRSLAAYATVKPSICSLLPWQKYSCFNDTSLKQVLSWLTVIVLHSGYNLFMLQGKSTPIGPMLDVLKGAFEKCSTLRAFSLQDKILNQHFPNCSLLEVSLTISGKGQKKPRTHDICKHTVTESHYFVFLNLNCLVIYPTLWEMIPRNVPFLLKQFHRKNYLPVEGR